MTSTVQIPQNPADMFKYDFQTIKTIREKLKSVNLWEPDKSLLKYKEYAGADAETLLAALTPEKIEEMNTAISAHEERIFNHGDIIQECATLAAKEEFKHLFADNFPFSRDCLFRLFIPRVRG